MSWLHWITENKKQQPANINLTAIDIFHLPNWNDKTILNKKKGCRENSCIFKQKHDSDKILCVKATSENVNSIVLLFYIKQIRL